ncbi:MAG: hypothetical protein K2H01_11295 [Ruminococcus sp.]|nr:hypothetical protein [Ruminococcus sp.]
MKRNRLHFTPVVGQIYKNKNGQHYECLGVDDTLDFACMVNIVSHWRFTAHGIGIYEDNTIDWDFSSSGFFEQ